MNLISLKINEPPIFRPIVSIPCLDKNKEIDYSSNIKVSSEQTVNELQEKNFTWPDIDKNYIETFLNYLKDKDFFKGE